jgi:MFS family permease
MATQAPREPASPEPSRPATSRPRQSSLSTLKDYKNFRLVWAGNFIALGGQWIQMFSIGWLVLMLTDGNAILTGTVIAIRALPILVIGPWAGVLADRVDRRKVVMATQAVMAVAACSFALLVVASDLEADPVTGPLRPWHPFLYMIISGIAHSIIQPVRQAMIANTVPRHALASALALNGMVYPSTRIIAPAIGGLIIATLGFNWNFFLEALAYVGIIVMLIPVKLPYGTETSGPRSSPLRSMQEGLAYVWRQKMILQLIVMLLIPNIVFQPLIFLLPVFTTEVLGKEAATGGILAAAMGVGGVIAAVIIAGAGFIIRRGLVTFIGLAGGSLFVILFSLVPWWIASFAFLTGLGFCQYAFRVANSTLIQTTVPDELRGRVMSIYMLDNGIMPVATLLLGLLIHIWSPSAAFTLFGSLALVATLLMALRFKQVRQLD